MRSVLFLTIHKQPWVCCALTWELLIILTLYRSIQAQESRPVPRWRYILRTLYPCAVICNSCLIHERLWFMAYELWSHPLLMIYLRMIRQQCTSDRQSSASMQLWLLNCRNELTMHVWQRKSLFVCRCFPRSAGWLAGVSSWLALFGWASTANRMLISKVLNCALFFHLAFSRGTQTVLS